MKTCVVNPKHVVHQKPFTKRGTDIYTCSTCGCVMADIDFVHEQYEDQDYYTMIHDTKDKIEEEWGFRWRHILTRITAQGNYSSLLDVGAGNGYFVDLALREYGLKASGLEISAEEIEYAKNIIGVDLLNESIFQHTINYDIVTCFNVLEHVPDPKNLLSSLAARMNPGGVLTISTPNPGCIHARVKGLKEWGMIDPPHHINLFTHASLTEMLNDLDMEVILYETLSTYINFVRKYDTKNLILRKIFFNALRLLNLGADHLFVLRKCN